MSLTFHTPPRNQGQIVEVSYAMSDDHVVQQVFDASDRTTTYYVSKAHIDDQGDYWNAEPKNKRWRKLDPTEYKTYGIED